MTSLSGRVAIVTGAARGLGRAHALALAAEGAAVVVNDLDADAAGQVAKEISAGGGQAVANGDDVADWHAAAHVVDKARSTFGDLHILVNNAGTARPRPLVEMEEEDWDSLIRVHLKGHFCMCRHAAAFWQEHHEGGADRRIVNTSSEVGLFGHAGRPSYAAAKGGIVSLTLACARELGGYGVKANAICPRGRTRLNAHLPGFEPVTSGFDRLAPENVSPFVAWLAGDDASDVTGQVFVVVGGTVHLMRGYEAVSGVRKDGRWTVAELAGRKAELFGSHPRGLQAHWEPG